MMGWETLFVLFAVSFALVGMTAAIDLRATRMRRIGLWMAVWVGGLMGAMAGFAMAWVLYLAFGRGW